MSFENAIDISINKRVMALQKAIAENYFIGFIETVPAYNSLAIFYHVLSIKKDHPLERSAFDFVKKHTEQLMAGLEIDPGQNDGALITVPVYYNGVDLAEVASQHDISKADVLKIHTEKIYRIFMLGFQPGFAYMGILDDRIATPRKATPRTEVAAGSVGIAGSQTGIYPFSSPGGWQLIGQTPLKLFDKQKANPCLFKAGDNIKFIAISKEEFEKINEY